MPSYPLPAARLLRSLLFLLVVGCIGTASASSQTIPEPGSLPSGLAFDGKVLYDSELFSWSLGGARAIYKLKPGKGQVLGHFLAPSPTGLDGTGNPSDLVYGGKGHLFVTDVGQSGAGMVYEIDTAGTTIFHSFPIPFRGGAIAFDGTKLFISDYDSGQILITNRSGVPQRTFSTALRPTGMVYDRKNHWLWVISEFDNTISQLTADGVVLKSCSGPQTPGIYGVGGITKVGLRLFISQSNAANPSVPPDAPGTIFKVDPAALTCTPAPE